MRQKALTRPRGGARNADVARKLNVPTGTISYWKHVDRAKRGECPGPRRFSLCPRCDGELDPAAYAYLLGLCPGDGHIIQNRAEPWQQEIVDAHPWDFIRGLIHSDGCRNMNWTTRRSAA